MKVISPPTRLASRLPIVLGVIYAVQCAVLGFAPYDRADWLLENLISIPVALWLVFARQRLPLSASGWILVFSFLALHEIGSHYTYSRVPWGEWSTLMLGWVPAFERNHFDRLVHFAFGLLMTQPIRECLAKPLATSAWLRWLLPVAVVHAFSGLYEIMEWAAAYIFDPNLGVAFVGAQGDVWDAQKDTSLALIGSVLATLIAALWSKRKSI